VHGGPDGLQPITCDFSTNANPLGPPPSLVRALAEADRGRYPDPSYEALRVALGAWHGVPPQHVVPTAGTSEGIRRLTLAASLQGVVRVWVPRPGYGDYAAAAQALQMRVDHYDTAEELLRVLDRRSQPALAWICEPCNPTGDSLPPDFWREAGSRVDSFNGVIALDRAYEALRLAGSDPVPATFAARTWQCMSPNKSLGLTGIRAGYLLAPVDGGSGVRAHVEALAPSWVLSAEGVALLGTLHQPETLSWLSDSRSTLANWDVLQREALARLGWRQRSSVVPFWLARPCDERDSQTQPRCLRLMRDRGVKVRDATSFGMPGWVRVSVQPPASQRALIEAWNAAR
jgi:histidinol-phosphate aminotransferase